MVIRTEIKYLERFEGCVLAMYKFNYVIHRYPVDRKWPDRFCGFGLMGAFFVPRVK